MKYEIGEHLKGYHYQDICHGTGDCIFWFEKRKMSRHVSRGTIMDNHGQLVKNVSPDDIWRGRASKHGNVIVMPPVEIYISKNVKLPCWLFNRIYKEFEPDNVFIELAGKGLMKIVNTSKH